MGFSITNNALVNYVKESKVELKKVVWPSRKKVIQHTALVIGVSLAMGLFFGALDFGLAKGFEVILNR